MQIRKDVVELWSYYGRKTKVIKMYPNPQYDIIIEPFAGTAVYSLYDNNWQKEIHLIEKYDVIVTIILNYIYTFINDYKYQVIFITINAISSASALFDTSTAIELRILLIIFGCVLGYIINKINFRKYFTLLKRKFRRMG